MGYEKGVKGGITRLSVLIIGDDLTAKEWFSDG